MKLIRQTIVAVWPFNLTTQVQLKPTLLFCC